jgi:hypothetical protein
VIQYFAELVFKQAVEASCSKLPEIQVRGRLPKNYRVGQLSSSPSVCVCVCCAPIKTSDVKFSERPERETDHSLPRYTGIKNARSLSI